MMLNGGPQKSHRQPDKRPADYKDERAGANSLGIDTEEWLGVHKVLSFRLAADNSGNIGNNTKRQIEGTIQKANNPWRTCMLCMSKREAIRLPNCRSRKDPATVRARARA